MKFTAYYSTTASIAVPIEADSADEAQEIADGFGDFPGLCAHCAGFGSRPGINLADWEQDGEVEER